MRTIEHEIQYRGEDLLKKIKSQELTICGAGAIGSNLVDNLIRQGFEKIKVIDFDRVDDHNRQTQIYTKRDTGSLKVAALKNHAFNAMGIVLTTDNTKITETTVKKVLSSTSIVIDGFDNSNSRRVIHNYCRDSKIQCLHIGLYEDYAEVCWNDAYKVPVEDSKAVDVCEYPLARNIVLLAVAAGSEAITQYIDTGLKKNFTITLKDLCISSF